MLPITVVFKEELPITVNGGLTIWSIERDRFGKGGSRLAIVARCVSSGESITLCSGRERQVESALRMGLIAKPGTIVFQIFTKLVKEGKAEWVSPLRGA